MEQQFRLNELDEEIKAMEVIYRDNGIEREDSLPLIIEEFSERNHQDGMKLDDQVKRIPNAEKRGSCAAKRKAFISHGEVQRQIDNVHASTARGKYNKKARLSNPPETPARSASDPEGAQLISPRDESPPDVGNQGTRMPARPAEPMELDLVLGDSEDPTRMRAADTETNSVTPSGPSRQSRVTE
mmetsp:Transcript_11725/g.24995  ORF Transcript_11725/g.24995 Transcript_11725/m.24995 type:complete len:185 (-) Transcript_11725:124-678(-)